jgi:hypothetical protein
MQAHPEKLVLARRQKPAREARRCADFSLRPGAMHPFGKI